MIPAWEAAYKLCDLSDWTLTNLKLQKILYLCHLFYLGKEGKPLIKEEFEAWSYGPVISSLYDKVKIFGNRPIQNIFYNTDMMPYSNEILFIQEKYPILAANSAWDLVVMTHLKGGAWEKYFNEGQKYQKISNDDIKEEYINFYA